MPTAHDLSMLDGDELTARLGDSRRELFNLRFQLATGQLDNPARVPQVRREVARMLTILRAREILEAEGAYVAPTVAEHEAARAKVAAEDAEREERDAARAKAAEAETQAEQAEFSDELAGGDIDDEDDEEEEA
jgi:large subunit ribosomal protein L29